MASGKIKPHSAPLFFFPIRSRSVADRSAPATVTHGRACDTSLPGLSQWLRSGRLFGLGVRVSCLLVH